MDALLEAGIKPVAVLYHWDLPQVLEDEGGWAIRATVDAFTEYSGVVVGHLGDRVTQWITQLEPWVTAWLGYGFGAHAPGRRSEADAITALTTCCSRTVVPWKCCARSPRPSRPA